MTDIFTLTPNPTADRNARIDFVVAEHKLRCPQQRCDPGRGSVDVAATNTLLGGETVAIYTIGGLLGRLLIDQGVRNCTLPISESTNESVIITKTESDQDARDAADRLIDRGKVQTRLVSLGRGGGMLVHCEDAER